jgi:hypothetical protein
VSPEESVPERNHAQSLWELQTPILKHECSFSVKLVFFEIVSFDLSGSRQRQARGAPGQSLAGRSDAPLLIDLPRCLTEHKVAAETDRLGVE